MINLKAFLKKPLDFKNLCTIYPPTINQIIEPYFLQGEKIITISQEEIEDIYNEQIEKKIVDTEEIPSVSPLEFLLVNCYQNSSIKENVEKTFETLLGEKVSLLFSIKAILIGSVEDAIKIAKEIEDLDNLRLINEEVYFDFQNAIREAMGEKAIKPPNPNEHPKIKAMKAKARYRDRIKAKQGKGIDLSTSLVAICCMGFGLNPLNIGEMSYAAISPLMNIYQEKEKYQLDIDSLLAGADSKKIHPKYWIRNLDN